MKIFIICLLSIVAFAVLTVIFYLVSSEFRYAISLKRKNLVARTISAYMYHNLEKYQLDFSWWEDKNVQTFKIKSHDGISLCGYYIDNNSSKLALIVHGYGSNAKEMQRYAKLFFDNGYSIVAIDNRGHGQSEGKTITMGFEDCKDINSWVNYLSIKFSKSKIVVFGLSMGAASVCLYSSSDFRKPKNVKAIISDCAYSNAYDVFSSVATKSIVFNILPTMKAFNFYMKARAGFELSDIDVCANIKKCDVPILLIHGDKDNFVPFYMRDKLYECAPKKFRHKFTVKNAGHGESLPKAPEMYSKKIIKFLKEYV